jgi:hypothetical protein
VPVLISDNDCNTVINCYIHDVSELACSQRNNFKIGKVIPVLGLTGLKGCEMLRIPHCVDNRLTDDGKVVSLTHRPHFTPQKHYFSVCGTHFS